MSSWIFRKMTHLLIFGSIVGSAFLSTQASAQLGFEPEVIGVVTVNGSPVQGASVRIRQMDGGGTYHDQYATSGSGGIYYFEQVTINSAWSPPKIRTSYSSASEERDFVQSGNMTVIDFALTIAPPPPSEPRFGGKIYINNVDTPAPWRSEMQYSYSRPGGISGSGTLYIVDNSGLYATSPMIPPGEVSFTVKVYSQPTPTTYSGTFTLPNGYRDISVLLNIPGYASGYLGGRVTNRGQPVANAIVKIKGGNSNGMPSSYRTTDANGYYVFPSLPAAPGGHGYILTVESGSTVKTFSKILAPGYNQFNMDLWKCAIVAVDSAESAEPAAE